MDIALTAILVACKAEETYKRIRQILASAYMVLNPTFTGSEVDVKIMEEHRLRVTQYEHIMLDTVGFNFTVPHPHLFLASLCKYSKCIMPLLDYGLTNLVVSDEEARTSFNKLIQYYKTPVILCFPPEMIAVAALMEAKGHKTASQIDGIDSSMNKIYSGKPRNSPLNHVRHCSHQISFTGSLKSSI